MSALNLEGIFPPIPTPFMDGEVAYEHLSKNVRKWAKTGIKGFVVLGSNGEFVFLSEYEKKRVLETVVGSAPDDMLIIAGTGCESTIETQKLTRACAELGAHAALVVTPHYFAEGMNPGALIKYYTMVADDSPIPILLYNVPKFTHVHLTPAVVAELSGHPNIVGIKDSSGSLGLLGEFLTSTDKDFQVLAGTASVLFGALALGCPGGILALANVAPEACVRIYNLVREGRYEEARSIQLRMIPVDKAVTATYGISGLKSALDMVGYFGGDPRLPLLPSTEEEKANIREILKRAELLS
ncbi:MAG: dihydrodipicolinate synthase family protein [Deltaproteobacteria bacterium]|nr:dihydrodipicolinate synthase family protein [Deltaproteobacteria bacterium]